MLTKKGFYKDEKGKWWYETSTGHRYSGEIFTCNGCGKEALKVKWKTNSSGKYYCSRSCSSRYGGGEDRRMRGNNPNWKSGRTKLKNGYINIYKPEHPNAMGGKYMREHRLVMEKSLGRYLKSTEYVHHVNGVKDDNRIENLKIVSMSTHFGKVHCPYCDKEFLIK